MDGPRGELVPVLAESLESDDLIDWTLILRPDLTFSDGTALDAAAVIAHIERAQNSESAVALEGSGFFGPFVLRGLF